MRQQSATLYTIQLGLNFIFMPLFFGYKRPIEGTIDILALTGSSAYLTYLYSQIDEVAAWTMVPYIGWLTFASYLAVCRFSKALAVIIALILRRLGLVTLTIGTLQIRKSITLQRISLHRPNMSTKLQKGRKRFDLSGNAIRVSLCDGPACLHSPRLSLSK